MLMMAGNKDFNSNCLITIGQHFYPLPFPYMSHSHGHIFMRRICGDKGAYLWIVLKCSDFAWGISTGVKMLVEKLSLNFTV